MGWIDLFFKSDPFEDDEPKEVEKKTELEVKDTHDNSGVISFGNKTGTTNIKPIPNESDTITNIAYSGGLNKKIYEAIHSEILEEKNHFSKFIELYTKMNKIIPNEMQCVAAVITSMEVSPSEVLNAVNTNYKNTLNRVKAEFDQEINVFIKENIAKKETEMKEISDKIELNNKQILELQKQNEELAQKGKTSYDVISNNKYKLEQKKSDFSYALQYENQVIEKWINMINNYDKSAKDMNL